MTQRLSINEKILAIATRIRPGEGLPTWSLIANAFFLLYSHYLLKVVRETLLLSTGSALDKSLANALSALAISGVIFVYTIFYKKFQRQSHRSLLTVFVNSFFFINILIFFGLISIDIKTPMVFYVWQSIYGILIVSHFWSFCADLMNQKSGKRLFPPIMIGASIGAWIGSLSADWVYGISGINSVLIAALICLLFATRLSIFAESRLPVSSKNKTLQLSDKDSSFSFHEGFRLLFSHRYLTYVAAFVILMNWINTTGEFIFAAYVKDAVQAAVLADDSLTQSALITGHYSTYYTWINLLGFLIQALLVSRLFRWFGITGSLLILPLVSIVAYGFIAFIPIFLVAKIAMIVENSTSYSIANTTRNALYLPLNRNDKYLGKTTIDTFCWRLGDLIQFGVIFAGLNWFGWEKIAFVWFNLGLSLLMLLVCYRIGRLYRQHDQAIHSSNPPILAEKIPAFDLCPGRKVQARISEGLFYDPDPGDALRYFLTTEQNGRLPDWIEFDRHNLLITFSPPEGDEGELTLKLRVTDADELSCETEIRVRWSNSLRMSEQLITVR